MSDDELEDMVTSRPDVLNRVVASGMLGAAVRELIAAGETVDGLVELISDSVNG